MELIKSSSLCECVKAKKECSQAVYLSGGTEVLRLSSSVKADAVIPVSSLIEKKIEVRGDEIFISSNMTFSELIDSEIVPSALKDACKYLASRALKNAATIGGNIAAKRCDSFLIPTLLAYDAKLVVFSGEEKICPLKKYVTKGGCNCIIVGILINPLIKVANKRESLTSSTHAAVTSAMSEKGYFAAVSGGAIYSSLEDALAGEIKADITGSVEYKKYLIKENYNILKEALNG